MDVKLTSACASAHGQRLIAFPKFSNGISLMDVMTSLAVASLLFGVGIPAFQSYLASSRLVSSSNLISRSLMLTRSEAVKRNNQVLICKSQDQLACTTAGSWRQGWIIFEDRLPDQQRNDDEPLILAQSELPAAIQLNYAAFRSSNYIAFQPTGITKTNGTFTLCYDAKANSAQALILSKTGRVRLSRARANGRALSCPETD